MMTHHSKKQSCAADSKLPMQAYLIHAHEEIWEWQCKAQLTAADNSTINALMGSLEVQQHQSSYYSSEDRGGLGQVSIC